MSRKINRIIQIIEHENEEIVNFKINYHDDILITFTNDY
jgi:hypothetical protein